MILNNLTNYIMKRIFLIITIVFTMISCVDDSKDYNKTDLAEILSLCDGYGVVQLVGFNEANFEGRQHILIIKDNLGVCREYAGTNFNVKKGDTLIKKGNLNLVFIE